MLGLQLNMRATFKLIFKKGCRSTIVRTEQNNSKTENMP